MKNKKRCYLVTVKLDTLHRISSATVLLRDGNFIAEKIIHAENRDLAVYLALQWYWGHLTCQTKPAHKVLTVDDPYSEVSYCPDFSCASRRNNYLTDDVITRVIHESQGILKRDTFSGKSRHPPHNFARVRRRRKLPKWVAPNIYGDDNETLFYRMAICSQISSNGRFIRYRKVRMVRLQAKKIPEALREIIDKGLFDCNAKKRKYVRDNGFRSLIKSRLPESSVISATI